MKTLKHPAVVLLLLWLQFACAQKTDSLLGIFSNRSLHDTTRLLALEQAAGAYLNALPDSCLLLSNTGYALAEKKGLKKCMARMLALKGAALINLTKSREALPLLENAAALAEAAGDKSTLG